MFADGFRNRAKDDTCFLEFIPEGRAYRYGIKYRVHSHPSGRRSIGIGAFHACQEHLLPQWNSKFFVCFQKLGIDFFKRLGAFFHALRLGVIILILIVNLRVIHHRPSRFAHVLPPRESAAAPIRQPIRFIVLGRNQSDDLFV